VGRASAGVRAASDSTIEIDFFYGKKRCRERLNLAPTPRNLEHARRVRGRILLEIAQRTFDYGKHFPNSARAARHSKNPGELTTVGTALDDWLKRKRPQVDGAAYNPIVKEVTRYGPS
jgi:integrase